MSLYGKFRQLRGVLRPARALRPRRAGLRLNVERLEDRTVPSVDLLKDFAGLAYDPRVPEAPPDPHVAAGPNQIVEVVNTDIAYYAKQNGRKLFESPLSDFFASVGASPDFGISPPTQTFANGVFDPNVSFDDLSGRFIVTALDVRFDLQTSHLLVAVSDDADPRGAWEMHRINVEDNRSTWGDFARLGWDADAIYVTLNMFHWNLAGGFSHASVITIDKASVLDGDSTTLTYSDVDRLNHFTMQPAIMHGATPGAPMYFLNYAFDLGFWQAQVVRMTNKLSAQPTFEDFRTGVGTNPPPDASQPNGTVLDTGGVIRIQSAAWRDQRLIGTQTVPAGGVARARWFEFDTSGPAPTLTQLGEINQGAGVHTYYPAIDIAPNGDLGMTFMQSSTTEFMSMYVTGRKAADPQGTMQTPVLVKAGEANYYSPPEYNQPPYRAGDYSGITVDPVTGKFWAASEYATLPLPPQPLFGVPDINSNWGTWIANFSIRGGETPQGASISGLVAAGPASLVPLQPRLGESLAAILLDSNTALRGWFAKPTPWKDYDSTTPGEDEDRLELLTALAHEVAGSRHVPASDAYWADLTVALDPMVLSTDAASWLDPGNPWSRRTR